ncbi:MAG: hypothetical protein JWO89_221, partial [Verrucomicrobiaceae bacterium]|nr:hypothetical protein [Verrucomicrobiaceae bacterium]
DAPPIPVALNEMVLVSYAPERLTVEARLPLVPLPKSDSEEFTAYATSCIRALEAARKK